MLFRIGLFGCGICPIAKFAWGWRGRRKIGIHLDLFNNSVMNPSQVIPKKQVWLIT